MVTISRTEQKQQVFPISTHIKNAVAYVLVSSLFLLFLNIYSSSTTRNLLYRSKEAALLEKAQLVTSSFSGVESLTTEYVEQVMNALGDLNAARVLVTDGEGRSLYDSSSHNSAEGKYVLFEEVRQALKVQDVCYCRYENGRLISRVAIPSMVYGRPVACVYLLDIDADQGRVIHALETNIFRISLGLEAIIVVVSALFAMIASRKMRQILTAMEKAREGEYSHKIQVQGHDEFSRLALEFNGITDQLQAAEEAQRRFVSDATHELKTPLASIKLLSDSILQNDMDTETVREFVSDIGNEADRLTRLAQMLLTLNKAEVEEQEHEVVDLCQIVNRVYKMLAPIAAERRIRLTFETCAGCTVLSVEDDMYQILFNLVENGIKYNTENGQVHVRLQRQEEDVIVCIEDTGIGIPDSSKARVFERFYRVDKARSRQAGGSGLGLSIVRDLVERNLGEISLSDSNVGGSVFRLVFPGFDVEVEE